MPVPQSEKAKYLRSDLPIISDIVSKKKMINPNAFKSPEEIAAQEEKLRNARLARSKADKKLLKAWLTDDSRVKQYNQLYQSTITNKAFDPYEIFLTYTKDDQSKQGIIFDNSKSLWGLSGSETVSLKLYPYAKNLSTGEVVILPDWTVLKSKNESHVAWLEKRASTPKLADQIPEPPSHIFGCDMQWDAERFKMDKFSTEPNIIDFYTFLLDSFQFNIAPKKNDK